jgi:hypothetical protein
MWWLLHQYQHQHQHQLLGWKPRQQCPMHWLVVVVVPSREVWRVQATYDFPPKPSAQLQQLWRWRSLQQYPMHWFVVVVVPRGV